MGAQRIKSGSTKLGGIEEGFVMELVLKLAFPWQVSMILRWKLRKRRKIGMRRGVKERDNVMCWFQ